MSTADPYLQALEELNQGLVQILNFKGDLEVTSQYGGRHLRVDPEGGSVTLTLSESSVLGLSLTIEQNGSGTITLDPEQGSIINEQDHTEVKGDKATVGLLLVQKAPNIWLLTGSTK